MRIKDLITLLLWTFLDFVKMSIFMIWAVFQLPIRSIILNIRIVKQIEPRLLQINDINAEKKIAAFEVTQAENVLHILRTLKNFIQGVIVVALQKDQVHR